MLRLVGAIMLLLATSTGSFAQTLVAPDSHWGALMFPELEPSAQLGFSLIQFTEFDKIKLEDDPQSVVRYNDIDRTRGFNILSLSRTRALRRFEPHQSNLFFRSSFILGVIDDRLSEYYQNDVIHDLRGLDHIPRGEVDTGFVLGYGGELNYNFLELTRDEFGVSRFRPTPMFIGGGFHFGTIYQDLYAQAGFLDLWWPQRPTAARFARLGLSGMVRIGVLESGATFDELARSYAAVQASVKVVVLPFLFPIEFEYGETGSSGSFLSSASADAQTEFGTLSRRRDPLREHFVTLRLKMGAFTVETFNDSRGDKDRGPTYGARAFVTMLPGDRMYEWLFSRRLSRF